METKNRRDVRKKEKGLAPNLYRAEANFLRMKRLATFLVQGKFWQNIQFGTMGGGMCAMEETRRKERDKAEQLSDKEKKRNDRTRYYVVLKGKSGDNKKHEDGLVDSRYAKEYDNTYKKEKVRKKG